MEIALQKLKRFNLVMGCLHLVQAIIMAFLATSVIQKIAEFQPQLPRTISPTILLQRRWCLPAANFFNCPSDCW